jgi:hypothetical protein
MEIVKSVNNIPIRLTDERWRHLVENHDDLAGYYDEVIDIIENPDFVIKGYRDALIALRQLKEGKYLSVIYKEIDNLDGFIISAYFTRKIIIQNEEILWPSK